MSDKSLFDVTGPALPCLKDGHLGGATLLQEMNGAIAGRLCDEQGVGGIGGAGRRAVDLSGRELQRVILPDCRQSGCRHEFTVGTAGTYLVVATSGQETATMEVVVYGE